MSMDGPDSRTNSCICEPGMPLATNRPCWRRCSPTAPIWASPAWPISQRGLGYHHLVNVAQWHIGDDNYVAARAAIVNAPHKHPMAAIRDNDGTTSSSDEHISGPEVVRALAVPSKPNTASIPGRFSTRTCPATMDRSTRGSFRRR